MLTPDGPGTVLRGEKSARYDSHMRYRGMDWTHHLVELHTGVRRSYSNTTLREDTA